MNNILYRLHQVSKGQKIQPAFILESDDYRAITSELERLQNEDKRLQSKYIDYCNNNSQRVSDSLLYCFQGILALRLLGLKIMDALRLYKLIY